MHLENIETIENLISDYSDVNKIVNLIKNLKNNDEEFESVLNFNKYSKVVKDLFWLFCAMHKYEIHNSIIDFINREFLKIKESIEKSIICVE